MGLLPERASAGAGRVTADGVESASRRQGRRGRAPRPAGDDLPGPGHGAQPGDDLRLPDRGGPAARARHVALPRRRPRPRVAPPGRHPRRRAPHAQLPARALGRHAPARDDRHRAVVGAEGAPVRRADDGARRHDPGTDPAPSRRPAGGDGAVHRLRHPRAGARRRALPGRLRHVRRPPRGDGAHRRGARPAAAPVHHRAAAVGGRPGRRSRRARSPSPGACRTHCNRPAGCAFHPRCFMAQTACETADVAAGAGRRRIAPAPVCTSPSS